MHQGAWIVWVLCAGAVAISTTNPFYLVCLVAVAFAVHAARHRAGGHERAFRMFLAFGAVAIVTRTALVVFGPVSPGAVAAAALEGARLAAMLALFGTFNSVTDPFRVLKLAPRRFHEPALAGALALSIAPRMIDSVARVRDAQRARGIRIGRLRALPALAVPVLEIGMEEAVTLAESMDARGHGRGPRSRYRPERWGPAGWTTVIASATALAAFVAAATAGSGDLAVSTVPLRWPDVSLALVAATVILAAPAFAGEDRA
ncbi:MAG: energy-coupling factor transporter transmembrane component T [Actinomycetota bacterium]